ncbi:MAG: c-type cytochrome [Alphaproteobacteria bacterium]
MGYRNGMVMTLVGLGLLVAGCTSGSGGGPVTKASDAPVVVAPKVVSAASQEQIRQGQVLFSENCVTCHQEGGVGKLGVAPSVTNRELLSFASDRFLFETVRDGRVGTPMPAFGEILKENDIRSIISYLRSYAKLPDQSAEADEAVSAMGDPRLGRRWFSQICAGCHGPNGEGYEGEAPGTAIGKRGFLDKASDGFIRNIIKNGRSNTPMRGFSGPAALADLSDREIDDIISYLRVLQ